MTESYYCSTCKRNHKLTSKIGREHQTVEPCEAEAAIIDPEAESELDIVIREINSKLMAEMQPLLDAYEKKLTYQDNKIRQIQDTLDQLLTIEPPKQTQGENPLGFIKELGINPADVGKVIQQFLGGGDPKREMIAKRFLDREEAMLNARIDEFLDGIYSDKEILVRDRVEGATENGG